MNFERIVVVTRKTRLEGLIERFNTRGQARFYINHSGGDFEFYVREHERYQAALLQLRRELQGLARLHQIERNYLANYTFTPADLVVTIGIDGLVVNTAKYLDGQPLIAVNPDPDYIDGVLLPFRVDQAAQAVKHVMQGRAQVRSISMAEARLNDGQSLLAFNDLFIGVQSHISARYRISYAGQQEEHSSSGIIVSTGAGSTGWLSSLFNMAAGILSYHRRPGGPPLALPRPELNWESEKLFFVVREPFTSKTSSAEIVCGELTTQRALQLESHMPAGGVIFSDGVEADFLAFNAGSHATIALSERHTQLVVG